MSEEFQLCIRVKPQAIPVLNKRLMRIMQMNAAVVLEEESDLDFDYLEDNG